MFLQAYGQEFQAILFQNLPALILHFQTNDQPWAFFLVSFQKRHSHVHIHLVLIFHRNEGKTELGNVILFLTHHQYGPNEHAYLLSQLDQGCIDQLNE